MKKWNLIIDVERCHYCNNCFLSNKDEYVGNTFPGYSLPQPHHGHHWIKLLRRERSEGSQMEVGYMPTTCNQCDSAPCIRAAKNGAVYKREDGIVMIDPDSAKGQKELVASCPYGHIWWNEELNVPQKWNFDAHLLDNGWKEPRPVTVCASKAFSALCAEDSEMAAIAKSDNLEVLKPELGTLPRVYYRNLHKFNKEFIAGSVYTVKNSVKDTAEGLRVDLVRDGVVLGSARTDFFGDFKFDRLPANSGKYTVKIYAGDKIFEAETNLNLSVTLPDMEVRM